MNFKFTAENLEKIEKLQKRYPKPEALSLPLLWMAQYQDGYISIDAVAEIAKFCKTTPMEIYRVATFYTMFNLAPVGRHHIQVCKTLSCSICGKQEILSKISQITNLKSGQTSEDGKFTLSQVECLGSCGTAPVMQINDTLYENLTPQKVEEILKGLE